VSEPGTAESPASSHERERFPSAATRGIVLPVVAAKVITLLFVAWAALVFPQHFSDEGYIGIYYGNYGAFPKERPNADIVFRTWDAEHCLALAAQGYGGAGPRNAYYPLFPALIRLASPAFGGDLLASALVLATLFGILALIVLHHGLVQRTSTRVANLTILLMCLQPAAFFTVLPYSESLFLLLLAAFFLTLLREHFWIAGLLGALLALTRAIGVFSFVPLLLAWWGARDDGPRLRALACLLPIAGFGAYLLIVYAQSGDPFLGMNVQKSFATAPSILRLFDPITFARELFHVRKLHAFSGSLLERLSFLAYVVALVAMARRRPKAGPDRALFGLSVAFGSIPAIATVLMSFTRYLSVIFPVFVTLAEALAPKSRRWALAAVGTCLLALQLVLLYRHVTFRWAG
jgi:hypothetical protein